jgi:hypothetical protein
MPAVPDPVGSLLRIAEAARDGRALDAADAAMLAGAVHRWAAGDAVTLDDALGLRVDPGQRRPATRLRLAKRDQLLSEAAATFYADLSSSAQASSLAKDLARYAASAWRHDRSQQRCPYPAGTLHCLLWGCAVKGGVFQWVQGPPGDIAPAGSNRSRHGGDEMSEASG